jgi:hypothetical protein
MKVSAWGTLLFLAWAPLVVVADGCSSQHEGERCDKTNNDLDCGAGLQCKGPLYVEGDNYFICCPIPPAKATVAACNASGGPPPQISDSGAKGDAATSDANDAGDATSESRPADDATGEASADLATNDDTADIAPDASIDMATADTQRDTAPTADGDDDATTDASSEEAIDAADDLSSDVEPDAEDDTDAPTADGPG